jgi:hypothetical protein
MQLTGVDVGGAGGLQGGCDGQAGQQARGHGGGAGHGCGGGVEFERREKGEQEQQEAGFNALSQPRARPPRLQKGRALRKHYPAPPRQLEGG